MATIARHLRLPSSPRSPGRWGVALAPRHGRRQSFRAEPPWRFRCRAAGTGRRRCIEGPEGFNELDLQHSLIAPTTRPRVHRHSSALPLPDAQDFHLISKSAGLSRMAPPYYRSPPSFPGGRSRFGSAHCPRRHGEYAGPGAQLKASSREAALTPRDIERAVVSAAADTRLRPMRSPASGIGRQCFRSSPPVALDLNSTIYRELRDDQSTCANDRERRRTGRIGRSGMTLSEFLRDKIGDLTAKAGCLQGTCGTCTV